MSQGRQAKKRRGENAKDVFASGISWRPWPLGGLGAITGAGTAYEESNMASPTVAIPMTSTPKPAGPAAPADAVVVRRVRFVEDPGGPRAAGAAAGDDRRFAQPRKALATQEALRLDDLSDNRPGHRPDDWRLPPAPVRRAGGPIRLRPHGQGSFARRAQEDRGLARRPDPRHWRTHRRRRRHSPPSPTVTVELDGARVLCGAPARPGCRGRRAAPRTSPPP